MLPVMSNIKRNLIAGVAAISVMAAGASPAMAWGKNEQKFLTGVLSVLAVQAVLREVNRSKVTRQPVYQAPVRYEPAPVSIYSSTTARAFNSYTDNEQRRIQSTLSAYGYYSGAIDGSFGPATYNAVALSANRTGKTAMLGTQAGAFGLLDGLLF